MNRTTIAGLAIAVLLGLSLSACSSAMRQHVAAAPEPTFDASSIDYPRVKRQVFNDPTAHDQFSYLLNLAEYGETRAKRGKGYRTLGAILERVGRHQEALRAYEAGALQGDGPSATIVIKAQSEDGYVPLDLRALVDLVYLPRARTAGTSPAILMADLVASGTISPERYGTSQQWLKVAADRGSSQATTMLAEAAEDAGDLKAAMAYYATIDTTIAPVDRALRQAKVRYLGEEVKPNVKLAMAWLSYAATLDRAAAAKVAAKLYREPAGTDKTRAQLMKVALAGGVDPLGGGFVQALRQVKTDAERQALLKDMRTAADNGSGNAALVYAQAMFASPDPTDVATGYTYLDKALASGLPEAAAEAKDRLVSLTAESTEAKAVLTTLDQAAGKGSAAAMWALADIYAWGGPVSADQAKSLAYVRAAADAGLVDAQLRIGLHYAHDTSDPANLALARHYLEAAAKQGSASARAYLAELPATS